MPPVIKNNWRDLSVFITAATAVVMVVFYVAPLRTLPQDVRQVRDTQISQTEILKTLSHTAAETKQLRRDVDKNAANVERLETKVDFHHP
jgi:antitoxin component of RelBE/YafQ-DinJ toxin-antitoxin module